MESLCSQRARFPRRRRARCQIRSAIGQSRKNNKNEYGDGDNTTVGGAQLLLFVYICGHTALLCAPFIARAPRLGSVSRIHALVRSVVGGTLATQAVDIRSIGHPDCIELREYVLHCSTLRSKGMQRGQSVSLLRRKQTYQNCTVGFRHYLRGRILCRLRARAYPDEIRSGIMILPMMTVVRTHTSPRARCVGHPADVLIEAYGKEVSDQIQKNIRECSAHQFTEAAAYRADLGYVPGK